MLELFRKSRIYLGVSLSDGISTSLLEALVTGAFPIQTNTSCAADWINTGISGFIIDPNKESVKEALKEALTNDLLVDSAAEINKKTALVKLEETLIRSKLHNFYSV